MLRIRFKVGRCAALTSGVCVSPEALDAGIACDQGRAHLLGHDAVAELRGFAIAQPLQEPGMAARWVPEAGADSILDLH